DVDVVEIAAGSGAESGDVVLAEGLPQGLLQITGVISAVECPPDGVRVHREDRSAGEKLLLLRAARDQDADLRIARPRRPDDVRIELARIESDLPVLHPITTVERQPFASRNACLKLGGLQVRLGGGDDFYQSLSEEIRIINLFMRV